MKKISPITVLNPDAGATKITAKELIALGIPQTALDSGEMHGEMKSVGPWQIPVSYRALCMSSISDGTAGYTITRSQTFYGLRTMSRPVQSGYELEGRVSVGGKQYRAFTSSQLFKLENGKLVKIAVVCACMVK